MSEVRVVSKAALPEILTGTRAPIWWAMIILVAIETTVFATLISSYLYLRFRATSWPPEAIPEPDLLLPIINTGVLLASSVSVFWGVNGLKLGDLRRLKLGVGVGIAMEVVFFSIKLVLSTGLGYGFTTHAYGSIFSAIDRFHTVHVVVAILMASVAEVLAFRGYFNRERRVGMQVVNIYWQFVAIIWIPVFIVLFLVPRYL